MTDENDEGGWALAMAVHVFTASGALCAFMALVAAMEGDLATMFKWLGAALVIDGIDGPIARAVGVERHAPRWDGATLDFVVDFLTYVLVPLAAIWRADLLPPAIAPIACGLVAAASALYFADRQMKLDGHWFRGFPALWNVLLIYLLAFPLPDVFNLAVMGIAAVLMFAPLRFVHPMRVRGLRPLTLAALAAWVWAAATLVTEGFAQGVWAHAALVLTGVYFLILPLLRRPNPYSARDPVE